MAQERISQLPTLDPGVPVSGGAMVPISQFQYGTTGTLTTFRISANSLAAIALSGVTAPGFIAYTGGGYVNRTFTGGNGIYVNNGDGSATPNWNLMNTGVAPGTYGTVTSIASVTVDETGRVTSATNIGFSAGGTIVQISSTSGIILTPSTITYTGSVGFDTGVLATLTNTQTLLNKTLSGGTLSGVTLSGATTLSGVTLSGSWTLSGVVSGGTLSGPTISGPTITGGTATNITLSSVTLTGSNVLATTLSGGTVSGSTLSAVTINGSTITGASTINNTTIGATVSTTVSATTAQVITLRFGDGTSMVTAATGTGGGTDVLQVQVFS